jgi:hypothetical protein
VKSLEVTINLVATADGVALVFQEHNIKAWLFASAVFLRRASRCSYQEHYFKPGYASAFSYGALRVGKSPLANEAQDLKRKILRYIFGLLIAISCNCESVL